MRRRMVGDASVAMGGSPTRPPSIGAWESQADKDGSRASSVLFSVASRSGFRIRSEVPRSWLALIGFIGPKHSHFASSVRRTEARAVRQASRRRSRYACSRRSFRHSTRVEPNRSDCFRRADRRHEQISTLPAMNFALAPGGQGIREWTGPEPRSHECNLAGRPRTFHRIPGRLRGSLGRSVSERDRWRTPCRSH